MEILHRLQDFDYKGGVVLTQGTFDGVHIGHQKILKRISEAASNIGGKSVLLTFYPHPRLVLYPEDNELKLLTSLDEKALLLRSYGIDYLIVLPFTKELSRILPFDFVKSLTEHLKISRFVIGYDHRFGRNREGSIRDIMEYAKIFDFEVEEIAEQDIDDCIISSSKIRQSILAGNMRQAESFLGRKFSVTGKVVEGKKMGRSLGYPTANISITDSYKILPGNGVYAVRVVLRNAPDITFNGMLNLGIRPTFLEHEKVMEVHIFDFTLEIYGQEIKIIFVDKLREEIKFASTQALVDQLKMDESRSKTILEHI